MHEFTECNMKYHEENSSNLNASISLSADHHAHSQKKDLEPFVEAMYRKLEPFV